MDKTKLWQEICKYSPDPSVVKRLLENINPNDPDGDDGSTLLMEAAFRGNEEIVRIMLEHGGDPAQVNDHGQSALAKASEARSLNTLKLLLQYNSDRENIDIGAIEAAATSHEWDCLRSILDFYKEKGNFNDKEYLEHGYQFLLLGPKDIRDFANERPRGKVNIYLLAMNASAQAMEEGLELMNDLEKEEYFDESLHAACRHLNFEVIAPMVRHGWDVNQMSKEYGSPALHLVPSWATEEEEDGITATLVELIKAGLDWEAQDVNGYTIENLIPHSGIARIWDSVKGKAIAIVESEKMESSARMGKVIGRKKI